MNEFFIFHIHSSEITGRSRKSFILTSATLCRFSESIVVFFETCEQDFKGKKNSEMRNGGNFLTKCDYFTFSLIFPRSSVSEKKNCEKISFALCHRDSRLAIKWSFWKMSRLNMKDIMTRWQVDDLSSNSSHSFAALINKTFIFAIKFLFFDFSFDFNLHSRETSGMTSRGLVENLQLFLCVLPCLNFAQIKT